MTIVCRRTALLLWIPKRNSEWNAVDWRTGRARPASVAAAGRDTRAIFSFLLFRRTVHRPSPCSGQSVSRLLCCLPEDGCGFFIVCTDHVQSMGRKPGRAWISAGGQFMSRGARATIQNQAISELQLLPSPRLYPGFRLQHGRRPESRGHGEPLSQKPRLLQPEEAESTAPHLLLSTRKTGWQSACPSHAAR